jgi:hypothetical protein
MMLLARANGAQQLVDDTLDAAIEIEKIRDGTSYDKAPLLSLAAALAKVSESEPGTARQRFFSPGYFEPLNQLMHARRDLAAARGGLEVFVTSFAEELRMLAESGNSDAATTQRLLEDCLTLHSALIEESSAADASRKREPVTLGFGSA